MRTYKTYNRYYCAILYPEDSNYELYLHNIMKYYTEVTYILHDKDKIYVNENGKITEKVKKPHLHILFKVGKNARGINSISEESEIPINYLEGCNKENMLLYFIHYKKKDKAKYSVNEVQGELKEYLMRLLNENISEENFLNDIILLIQTNKIKTTLDFVSYCIRKNKVDIIRKYSYIITKILQEKNYIDNEREKK